ncbi:MAG: response regulator [Halofilum sp. (in: g-proteobacteria)]|nr:response regulator [Halofilum sp. (in: g-proteobacteria)]
MIADCDSNCHVLHVEDHNGDALIVERLIERINRNIKLVHVPDGEAALEHIRSARHDHRVDVVLLDLMLPKMQGTELLAEIRSDRTIQDTPVVALTSSQDETNARICHERGINGFLQKDDGPAVLSHKLARILGLWCSVAANSPDNADYIETSEHGDGMPRRRRSDAELLSDNPRVLIVDDSAPDASMMARFLQPMENLEIVTATESREADTLLRNERFDVILLDYRMPGLSGLDYLEVIRRRDPDVGIIMVTAFSDEKVVIKSIRRRVDDYLRKEDLTGDALLEAIENLLVRVRRRRSAAIDPVTGLFCARALTDRVAEACGRLCQHGEEFSLLLIDLNAFAGINVRHGRATGDRVLRRIANGLPDALRPGDLAARYREDEFCIVAPTTGVRHAESLAERLRDCIRRLRFDYGDGEFSVDCAIGVGHFDDAAPATPEPALELACEAMREARAATRGLPIRTLELPRRVVLRRGLNVGG